MGLFFMAQPGEVSAAAQFQWIVDDDRHVPHEYL